MSLFTLPRTFHVAGGNSYDGAKLYFYASGTTTDASVYSDSARTELHAQPVVADAGGVFPAVWLNPAATYRVRLTTSSDVLLYDEDPYPGGTLDAEEIGLALYPRTAAEIAAAVTPTAAGYAYPFGDVRRYGVTGDGTDEASRLNNAIAAVKAGEVTRTPADSSSFNYGPALYIPGGMRITTTGGHLFPRIVRSDGYATIFCSNDAVDVFTGADSYSCYWQGIILEGGKSQVVLNNANLNAGEWVFFDCEFFKSADYAIKALNTSGSYAVTSTNLWLINCRIRACRKHLHTQCDHTWIHAGWQQPQQALFDDNSAAIRNDGYLHLDSVMMIPFAQGSATPVRRRWIDNYGAINARHCRFGGENGGIPIVYHFAAPVEFDTYSANSVQAGIVFDGCELFVGQAAVADSSIINCRGELPMRISVRACTGIMSSRKILKVETAANGGIDSIATYITAFETLTGNGAVNQIFYEASGNMWAKGSSEFLWPTDIVPYLYGDDAAGRKTITCTRLQVEDATPLSLIQETDQAADERNWAMVASSKVMSLRAYNDALSASSTALSATRGTGSALTRVDLGDAAGQPPVRLHGTLQLTDGITAPGTATGFACIYVDSADGDLKIKFGDGIVKTIVVDT